MLKLKTDARGVSFFASPLLEAAGVPHAFSTRLGGVSAGPFASLNLGNPNGAKVQDDRSNIQQNYRLLTEACGLFGRTLCRVHQVHGADVVELHPGDQQSADRKADALISDAPELAVSVRTADCVPILIANRSGTRVAAVHAGWRGIVAGVLGESLRRMGDKPEDLLVAIGPCIGLDAFAVGEEVACDFRIALGPDAPIAVAGFSKPHIDLRAAVTAQAVAAGVPQEQIDSDDLCTVRDRKLFFSHRRDAGITGRMAAVIGTK